MNDLEKIFSKEKTCPPGLNKNFSYKIMKKISSEEIKQISKTKFIINKVFKNLLFLALVFSTILILNFLIFNISISGAMEFFEFGFLEGARKIFENTPPLLAFLLGIFLAFTVAGLRKIELTKKYNFSIVSIILILFIGLSGSALAESNFNEKLVEPKFPKIISLSQKNENFLKNKYLNYSFGKVEKVEKNLLVISRPKFGDKEKIIFDRNTKFFKNGKLVGPRIFVDDKVIIETKIKNGKIYAKKIGFPKNTRKTIFRRVLDKKLNEIR